MTITTFAPRQLLARSLAGSLAIAAAFSSGLVALTLFGVAPAAAQEDNFTEQMLTTLGLVAPPGPDIDYRERGPLVVPPTGDTLPAPRDAAAITQNPAWPKDYDDERKKKEQAASKKVKNHVNDNAQTRALTPAEMASTRTGVASNNKAKGENAAAREDWLKPSGMDFLGWGAKKEEKPLVFAGEPDRESLTQPPTGFQTPAPGAAYGVVADRPEDKAWNPLSWFDQVQRNKERN
ncbi:hypothetical protein LGR54_02400 [Ancylobacter sp. Lp-2]|uniref:hypothetical protein n=1 Tax=Ancylobacter sp. Lp-2 TaxID=2881339 RepID=UPI001E540996|nr:hypothetical protein [Ancylobacter sp. Lp-2]MCB4767444.1 hypothetical protein [Ancylobacter sp. Lp-2]